MNAEAHLLAMPYPGLRPFEESDRALFYGRESHVLGLLRQLKSEPFVAVVGSSGSGKSSLVRAGLLPAVRNGFLLRTKDWKVAVVKPGHQPHLRLLRELHYQNLLSATDASPLPDAPITDAERTALPSLLQSERGLLNLLDESGLSAESRLLVVVDQFEELFAFRRAGASREMAATRDEAAAFVRLLMRSCTERESRIRVVLTMRSDFIGDCDAFLGLPEAISRSQFLVPRLDRSQMAEAIERPGQVTGQGFSPFTFEDGLINRLINDAGDRPDQLPLLQHALMQSWKKRKQSQITRDDYEKSGGIDKALSQHADEAWKDLESDPQMELLTKRLFLLLCDISPDGQITRRRPKVQEVLDVTGAKLEEVEKVVRLFQVEDRNFLLPPSSQPLTADTFLDISHEALLRRWDRFATKWRGEELLDASELRRLIELARLHKKKEGGLLPARDLARVDAWKESVSENWSRRYAADDDWKAALVYMEKSRKDVKFRRFVQVLIGLVFALTTLLTVRSWTVAKMSAISLQNWMVESYLLILGRTGDKPSVDEQEALWKLATKDQSDLRKLEVPELLVDRWFDSPASFDRIRQRSFVGLRAAGDLNPVIRQQISIRAAKLTDELIKELETETDASGLGSLSDALTALTARLEPAEAARFTDRLLLVMAKEKDAERLCSLNAALAALAARLIPEDAAVRAAKGADRLLTVMETETDAHRLSSLSDALKALAARLEPEKAAYGSHRLLAAMTKETDANRLAYLSGAVRALAARLEPEAAKPNLESLCRSMKEEKNEDRLRSWSSALTALAAQLDPADASSYAALGSDQLIEALKIEHRTAVRYRLRDALTVLAKQLQPKDAARGNTVLLESIENETDVERLWILSEVLTSRLKPPDAAMSASRASERLIVAMEAETNADRLHSLSVALAPLAAQLDPKKAASYSDRLLRVMKEKDNADWPVILSHPLTALVARLQPADAASYAARGCDRLIAAMEMETDVEHLRRMMNALTALADRLNESDAARGCDRLLSATENENEIDAYRLSVLSIAIAALAARMEPEHAASHAALASQRLLALMKNEGDANRLNSLNVALTALLARSKPAQATMQAARVSDRLLAAMEKETDIERLSGLRDALWQSTTILEQSEMGRLTRLFALSHSLVEELPGPPGEGEAEDERRAQFVAFIKVLEFGELTNLLKWPFCVGEAEKLVLAELEERLSTKFQRKIRFDGEVGKLIAQAPSLGIMDLAEPAQRPTIAEARAELAAIIEASEKRP